jgi:hypothetical protein
VKLRSSTDSPFSGKAKQDRTRSNSNARPQKKKIIHRRAAKGAGTVVFGRDAHFQHESNWSSIFSPHFGQVHMVQEDQVKQSGQNDNAILALIMNRHGHQTGSAIKS